MKYLEMYQSATAQVGVFAPIKGITPFQGLVWISEALHELQVQTGVLRCIDVIDLDPQSDDGAYSLCDDVDVIDKVEYRGLPPQGSTSTPIPVNVVDFDTFQRLQGQMGIPGAYSYSQQYPFFPGFATASTLPGQQPSPFYVTRYKDCQLKLWPFQGVSGTLTCYYKSAMLPYTPSAEGRWSTFGPEPSAAMAVNAIPREFNAALLNIKQYVMAMIISQIPGHNKLFPGKYEEYMAGFYQGAEKVEKKHPPIDLDSTPTPRFGRIM